MGKVKEYYSHENIFGDLDNYVIRTNYPEEIVEGKRISIVNPNCEFEFDSITHVFDKNIYYAFIVELKLLNVNVNGYVPDKSDNGGHYAFADAEIIEIKERGY